mmetsp:Transcript_20822/g.63714  ORF Transcript_20822/g.63714 Transcript_20822/m.63714 type:complete len:116 (+) Transcript_20822:56-403(+)
MSGFHFFLLPWLVRATAKCRETATAYFGTVAYGGITNYSKVTHSPHLAASPSESLASALLPSACLDVYLREKGMRPHLLRCLFPLGNVRWPYSLSDERVEGETAPSPSSTPSSAP